MLVKEYLGDTMKLIVLGLLVTTGALASYYQTTCSNFDGTVKYHNGHSKNGVEIKEFDSNTGDEVSSTLYPLSRYISGGQSVKVSIIDINTLNVEEEKKCSDSGSGYFSRTVTSNKKIKVLLIADHREIEDFYICKFFMSGRTSCK